LQKIYEWHDKLPPWYKYVVLISGCNPLLTTHTVDSFIRQFVVQEEENLFAVIEKKQYYWNKEGIMVTPWPGDQTIMNTKAVEPTYEAAHVLYASRLDLIAQDRFMGDFQTPGGIKLFTMSELEAFDIDYDWQFKVGEVLYNEFCNTKRIS
jgi:CMP-N-acetylneuraminic acid synthetase